MNIRRKVATAAMTGVLLVGGAGVAFADGYETVPPTTEPTTPTPPGKPGQPGPGKFSCRGKDCEWVCTKTGKGKHATVTCEWVCTKHKPCPSDCKHNDKNCPNRKPKPSVTKTAVRGRQHPVTGTAAALYAVGGGLLAATGGTVLVSQKRRKVENV